MMAYVTANISRITYPHNPVIPAQAGIQIVHNAERLNICACGVDNKLDSGLRRNDGRERFSLQGA
jgi:hypothetical protein